MRRMLTVQDRAAIAKGLVGRLLAVADRGTGLCGSVSVVSREGYAVTVGSVGISPCGS